MTGPPSVCIDSGDDDRNDSGSTFSPERPRIDRGARPAIGLSAGHRRILRSALTIQAERREPEEIRLSLRRHRDVEMHAILPPSEMARPAPRDIDLGPIDEVLALFRQGQ